MQFNFLKNFFDSFVENDRGQKGDLWGIWGSCLQRDDSGLD